MTTGLPRTRYIRIMPWCVVPGCVSDSRKDARKYPIMRTVKFRPFPKKSEMKRRKKWMDLIRRPLDYRPKYFHRVCSRHFTDEDAPYPTLFPWNNYGLGNDSRSMSSIHKRESSVNLFKNSNSKEETNINSEYTKEDTDDSHDTTTSVDAVSKETVFSTDDVIPHLDMPVYIKEIEVQTENTEVPFSMDHTYSNTGMKRDEVITVSESTQTDLTLEDMKKYEKHRNQNISNAFMSEVTASDKSIRFYTGIPSLAMFWGLLNLLVNVNLKYYTGKDSITVKKYEVFGKKPGPARKLSNVQEFTLTLIRLRHALPTLILANLFNISGARVSQIFTTWITHMSLLFSRLIVWPSRQLIQKHMPRRIKMKYPKLRSIIDCTEFFIQKPRNPASQAKSYSSYKSHNTFKCLVSITPTGAFNFVSDLWGGNTSDRYITMHSGFLDHVSAGDEIMADRGFLIRDLLTERRAILSIPPFTRRCSWGKGRRLNAVEIRKTRFIANTRIHVERAIRRIKQFKLLTNVIQWPLKPLVNPMLKTSAFLCNLMNPLVKN